MKNGFSLLEIIFVVVIIGIIATIGLPKLSNLGSDARASTVVQDVATLKSNLQSYYLINQKINKISDVVGLNSKVWKIEDLKVLFIDNDKECLKVEVEKESTRTLLKITIDSSVGAICEKIANTGVANEAIYLN